MLRSQLDCLRHCFWHPAIHELLKSKIMFTIIALADLKKKQDFAQSFPHCCYCLWFFFSSVWEKQKRFYSNILFAYKLKFQLKMHCCIFQLCQFLIDSCSLSVAAFKYCYLICWDQKKKRNQKELEWKMLWSSCFSLTQLMSYLFSTFVTFHFNDEIFSF